MSDDKIKKIHVKQIKARGRRASATPNPVTVINTVEKVIEKDTDEDYASQDGFHNK
jgi:hypothetical protein